LVFHEVVRRAWSTEGLVISEEYVAVSPETAPAPAAEPKKGAKKAEKKVTTSSNDDLKLVEGIGPKIEELLNNAGISTFVKLSETPANEVKDILNAAGKRYQMHDPSTWAKQAKMASEGKMAELKIWQSELKGGK
jgi:predicted flap endonuclease-1-like 5' DNA nuclease